ncbi:MAG: murein biosynthesis integral membrane protein MurJ [Candidatus Brocadiales bacterium]|nr:murein biosynthesis integral membrane protein MurJ [Candidatus Bathyanammoxibius amoris]
MPKHSFIRSASTISLCTLLSRVLGLTRDILCASVFGTGMVWDAFSVAFRVPNLFRRLFGEGALTAAFVPVFTEYLEKRDERESWRLVSVVATVLGLFLGLLVVLGEVVFYILPRLTPLSEKWQLVLELLAVMFPYMPLICLAALISAVLNCLRHFLMPALSPVILNVCWIAGLLFLAPMMGDTQEEKIFGVALAILIAGVLQYGVQLLVLRKEGDVVSPILEPSHPGLRKITGLIGPVVFGLAIVQVNVLLDSLIAIGFSSSPGGHDTFSFLGNVYEYPLHSGAASVLYYGDRIIEFPLALVGIAMATAMFPTISTYAVRNDWEAFSTTLRKVLQIVIFISVPASLGLMVLGGPLIELFFVRHAFTEESALRTTSVVFFYATGIWAFCSLHILIRAFYSIQDTKTPVKVGASMVVLNLTLNLTLIWFLKEGGLAFATAISAMTQATVLFVILRKRLKIKGLEGVMASVGRTMLASAVMVVACIIVLDMLPEHHGDFSLKALRLFAPLSASVVAFLVTAYILGSEELRYLYDELVKKAIVKED